MQAHACITPGLHTTYKHKHKKMETIPFSYAYVYAYVTPGLQYK